MADELSTKRVTHALPAGGSVTVTVTAQNPTEQDFPVLRESTAQATAEALIWMAAVFMEGREGLK